MPKSFLARFAFAIAFATFTAGISNAQVNVDFNASNGGFTTSFTGNAAANWTYSGTGGLGGVGAWTTPGANSSSASLVSPVFVVQATGNVTGSISHRFNFEQQPALNFDGGVLQYSVNGGAFQNIGISLVGGTGYAGPLGGGSINPLTGIDGFGGTSPDYATAYTTSTFTVGTASAQTLNAGDQIQFSFTGGWDGSILNSSPNWDFASASFANVTPVPEPGMMFAFSAGATGLLAFARRRVAPAAAGSA